MLSSLNKGKIIEYRDLYLSYPDIEFKSIQEVAFNPTALSKVETGSTYEENAFLKCQFGHYAAKYPTIADDTGIEVDALSGRPGVLSERSSDMNKLLHDLRGIPKEKRTARFVCVIVFMIEGIVLTVKESVEGIILEAPGGSGGFGYDPIFIPQGSDKSFGMMSLEEKNKISHRAKAFHKLMSEIKERHIKLVHP